ncbi:uncharacterized protein C8A04DRAFT_33825 [Dichotomopilus funicola]|uniref:Extracellular serine-rich protein n=1 Tax=Dichotomopilus funicola TaxID=1934379 RepID=A0AAN6VB43_9PEZI|nr:hypothetical protein C8A04DRAFT_33825 [Dichotomopilus funicola]
MLVRQVFASVLAAMAAVGVAAQQGDDDFTTPQEGLPSPTSTPSPTGEGDGPTPTDSAESGPATHTIAVGANGHVFTPNHATAKVGDIVQFNFYPAGDNPHRVARAAFGWPCIPYENAAIDKPGFYSGIIAPQVIMNPPPSYSVRVNDTEPIFFYCAAPGSCINYHMVGVINPNSTQTLEKQLEFANEATYQLMPGEPFPSETPVPTPTPGAGPPDDNHNSNGSGGGSGLSAGAIAGIAIGGAAVLILGAVVVYLCGRRGGFDKAYRRSALPGGGGNGGAAAVAAAGATAGAAGANGDNRSPNMVEANYPKSPGQTTLSSYGSPQPDGMARNSFYAANGGANGGYPYPGPTPSPGPQQGGGYGHAGVYPSPYSSPRAEDHHQHQQTPFLQPAPVELPSGDAPAPAQSPPPGYIQNNLYRPSGKP